MSNYLIGIGGTGAKCIESLVHLLAAGFLPGRAGSVYTCFVDPDQSNGSLSRSQRTVEAYQDCRHTPLGTESGLFETEVAISQPMVWSPFPGDQPQSLSSFFCYDDMSNRNVGAGLLFETLFSEDERNTNLNIGFRGHPSIGSAVFANSIELSEDEPWRTFRDFVRRDVGATGETARIVLVGSIFGGTGAAGVPTIGRLIEEELRKSNVRNAEICAILLLPYFSFDSLHDEQLRADASDFLVNCHAALKYYHKQDGLKVFDSVYVLGERIQEPVGQSVIGGRGQVNQPHFIELIAALAALRFYETDERGYFLASRREPYSMEWQDLPSHLHSEDIRNRIDHMLRFCFSYLAVYYPMLNSIGSVGGAYRAPWYIELLSSSTGDFSKDLSGPFAAFSIYSRLFLEWIGGIQASGRRTKINLANSIAFGQNQGESDTHFTLLSPQSFDWSLFDALTLPKMDRRIGSIADLWESMCSSGRLHRELSGPARLLRVLYENCRVSGVTAQRKEGVGR